MSQSSKTVIHFIRHGQVENPTHVRYGRLPGFHLSSDGREQIEQTAHYLTRFPVRAMYASPLERAQQTVTLLALAHPMALIKSDVRLLENKTSPEFEGKSRHLAFTYPLVSTPDSETTMEIIDRLLDFCRSVVAEHAGQHVVAVSHGDPIGLLYHWLQFGLSDKPGEHIYPGYGSDWQFVWTGHTCQSVISTFFHRDGQLRQ